MKDAGIAATMNGIAFATLDGRLTHVNEAFVQLWRLEDASQAVGRSSQEFWHDPSAAAGALQAVVSGGRWSGELEGHRPDGSTFPVIVSAAPILDAAGKPFRLIGTFQDISDRKRAEEAVRSSEAALKAAQRLARVGSWERDLATGVLSWSDELYRIFEYDPVTVRPGTEAYLARIHPEDVARVRELVARWMLTREPYESQHRLLLPDGRVKHVHQISQVRRDARGEATQAWGTLQDVTEVREAELKLREYQEHLEEIVAERTRDLSFANHELEAFASSVSHDLRAPLRGIDGLLKLLEEREGERVSPAGRELIGRVQAGARRMGTIIADLLRLARVTRATLRRERLDLTSLAHAVAADLDRDGGGRMIEWRIGEGLAASGDPGLVRLVLENLMGNAWKYTGRTDRAVIEVGSEGREDSLSRFFVRDNGAGFDMAHAGLLFQPFRRLHGAHEFEGVGVGLATVQRVIARHGGTVQAEGRVGEGACFRFTLPTGEEQQ
jgi:PAS domain S-box-containing protein